MQAGDQILERKPDDDGYVAHRLTDGTPNVETWPTVCGGVFRSKAMLDHPLLPARPCPRCFPTGKRELTPVRGIRPAGKGA